MCVCQGRMRVMEMFLCQAKLPNMEDKEIREEKGRLRIS